MKLPGLTLVLLLTTGLSQRMPRTNLPTPRHSPGGHCAALFRRPEALSGDCVHSTKTKRCKDGSYRFFSQMKQDYYLYTRHFRHLRRRGVYLDVAANDAVHLSNTYFFDSCLRWAGLCVEALPGLIAGLHDERSCAVLPTCVGDREDAEVEFVVAGGLSGVRETNKNRGKWGRAPRSIRRVCTTLGKQLALWDVRVVDYLSLDVEGHELKVLQGVDWGRVVVNVMTVEVTKESLKAVEEYLRGKGYVRRWVDLEGYEKGGLLNEDALFVHHSVVWGKPK